MKSEMKKRAVKRGVTFYLAALLLLTSVSLALGLAGAAAAQGREQESEETVTLAPDAALQSCEVGMTLAAGEGCRVNGSGTSLVAGPDSACIVLFDPSLLVVCHATRIDSSTVVSAGKADDGSWLVDELAAETDGCGELRSLHDAVRLGNAQWVACLATSGADVNARDESGVTPLHIAVSDGAAGLVEILIEAGADVSVQSFSESAVPIGVEDLSQLFAAAGSDINLEDTQIVAKAARLVTPLQLAVEDGNMDLVQILAVARMNAPEQAGTSSPTSAATADCAQRDRDALVALYNATGGENWRRNRHWLSEEPVGTWHGVTTGAHGCVTSLLLEGNELAGALPAELGDLASLIALNLSENHQLGGEIPAELGNLSNLESLDLSDQTGQPDFTHALRGEIPAELGNLTRLRVLDLSWHRLSGEIPPKLANLTKPARSVAQPQRPERRDTPGPEQTTFARDPEPLFQ